MSNRLATTALAAAALCIWATASFACGDKTDAAAAKASKKDSKVSAVAASANGSCASKASAVTASATKSCASKASAVTAESKAATGVMAVPVGASCSRSYTKSSGATASTDCAVCDEFAGCDEKLTVAGAVTQVVPLKNGVMFVYTASTEANAHAVQSAVRHRHDRIIEIASQGGKDVSLCDTCKYMRGAMASSKLRREVVNVEGGSLTLVTSEDPAVVKAIQNATGVSSKSAKS